MPRSGQPEVPGWAAEPARELRRLVTDAVAGLPAEGMLLSGGLDTSILAPLAAEGATRTAVTVLCGPGAPDRAFAVPIAWSLGWTHRVVEAPLPELLAELPLVVRTLRTFDPMEIRNSLVIARALRTLAEAGVPRAMTGDAADELFGGYSFMWAKPEGEFETYSRRMAETMRFSSVPLGRALGVEVRAPYTDPAVVRFAVELPKRYKVGTHEGRPCGKMLLRWAFPETLAVWRRKDPIEVGSGSTQLPRYFSDSLSPDRFRAEQRRIAETDRVEIRDAEHLAYYRAFRAEFDGAPPLPRFAADPCARCGYELPRRDALFCPTCGAYPARTSLA